MIATGSEPEPGPEELAALAALLNGGRADAAERRVRVLLERHPGAGILWKMLAAALLTEGKDALEAQRKAAELLPDDAEAHAVLGAALHERGRWVAAATSYRRALALNPLSPDVQNNLGNVLVGIGQIGDAVECYRCALRLKSDDPETLSNLGNALRRLGRLSEAMASCRRAIELDPTVGAAHDNLGLALAAAGNLDEAKASYRRSLELNPRNVVALGGLGNALRDLGDLREAVTCHLRAVKLDPKRAEAYYDLGNIMMDLGRLDEAAASYTQVLALEPSHEAARLNLGVILRQRGHTADAEAMCRAALAQRPDSADALVLLGELCGDRGQFAHAHELIQRAISINSGLPHAWSLVAAHRKMTADDSAWLQGAERLIAKRPPLRHEVRLRYSLGKYFDDIETYDKAFENFRLANELTKRYGYVYDQAEQSRRVDETIERFDRAAIHPVSARADSTLPVFILGMARSGTSLAEQILASHPNVFGAGELDFWDRAMTAYRKSGAGFLPGRANEYLDRLKSLSGGALRVVDKMPSNFMNVGLIHAALPAARIIHMRRSPLDTCLSIYFHQFPRSHSYANDLQDLAHYYGEYARIMDHWLAVLPPENVLEIRYESLIEDHERWTRRMLEFIGLPWDPACLNFERTERVVITASKWQVRQKIHAGSVGRWRHYEPWIGRLRQALSEARVSF